MHRTPELPVVLLEDFGALTGLVLALVGVSTAALTGDSRWDAYATISIGVLLVIIAVVLVLEMKSLIIGEPAIAPLRQRIVAAIEGTRGMGRVIHMRTQHIGPDQILVAAKVELDPSLDTAGVTATIDRAQERVRKAVPIATLIYLEPEALEPEGPE